METLADMAPATKDPDILTEYVRQSLSESIVQPYLSESNSIRGIALDPSVEKSISEAVGDMAKSRDLAGMGIVPIQPALIQSLFTALTAEVEKMVKNGFQPVVVTAPGIRIHFKKLVEAVFPNLVVLSYGEIPARVHIESMGTVRFVNAG